jgi:hypothetical protein
MLAGDFGWTRDGRRLKVLAHAPFTAADGWVNQVHSTTGAIYVSTKDGEPIKGGLLRKVVSDDVTLELYAKQSRWDLDGRTYNQKVTWGGWGPAHEFFLLARADRAQPPLIVRRWKMPFDGPGRFFLRGFLDYDSAARIASVRITDGLERTAVDERVSLRDCRR